MRVYKGFTLIEVLISVLIVGIGVLGTLNLQARALMDNQDAYLRTQAIFLAYDMSDRIRANKEEWQGAIASGDIDTLSTAKYSFCSAYDPEGELSTPLAKPIECSATEIAQYDVYRWRADANSILGGGIVKMELANDKNTTAGDLDIIRLTIDWNRFNQASQEKLGKAIYTLDVRP